VTLRDQVARLAKHTTSYLGHLDHRCDRLCLGEAKGRIRLNKVIGQPVRDNKFFNV
jgi:hypothetical protein